MRTALICDPDHDTRIALRRKLKELGFDEMLECRDGESAVVTACANSLEIAIIDISLRRKDRSNAAFEIRRGSMIPILLLTACCDQRTLQMAKRIGAAEILVKPFRDHDLALAVEMAFAHTEEVEILKENVKDLNETIESRRIIEKAKEVLMRSRGLYPFEAFRRIQKLASDNQTSMRKIAEAFLLTEGL